MRVPWTARRSNQSILKEISPGCSLEGLMLKSFLFSVQSFPLYFEGRRSGVVLNLLWFTLRQDLTVNIEELMLLNCGVGEDS